MGARGIGHIAYLCEIAPPRIGVVLNVGVAHIGEFGSVEASRRRRASWSRRCRRTGWRCSMPMIHGYARWRAGRAARVGSSANPPMLTSGPRMCARRARPGRRYTLVTPAGRARVNSAWPGGTRSATRSPRRPWAGRRAWRLADVVAALAELRLVSRRRMDVFDRADGVTVIDDSYNANPASTAAALRALTAVGYGPPPHRRARLHGRTR